MAKAFTSLSGVGRFEMVRRQRYTIAQAADGFLWLGTDNGLVRI